MNSAPWPPEPRQPQRPRVTPGQRTVALVLGACFGLTCLVFGWAVFKSSDTAHRDAVHLSQSGLRGTVTGASVWVDNDKDPYRSDNTRLDLDITGADGMHYTGQTYRFPSGISGSVARGKSVDFLGKDLVIGAEVRFEAEDTGTQESGTKTAHPVELSSELPALIAKPWGFGHYLGLIAMGLGVVILLVEAVLISLRVRRARAGDTATP